MMQEIECVIDGETRTENVENGSVKEDRTQTKRNCTTTGQQLIGEQNRKFQRQNI